MEKPPPLPPRVREHKQFLSDMERARTLSLETFQREGGRQSVPVSESNGQTGTDIRPLPRPGGAAMRRADGALSPPPSLPPRRPAARTGSCVSSLSESTPPLPPRLYNSLPPPLDDLICWEGPTLSGLSRLYQTSVPPPLPPRVPSHPLNTPTPPSLQTLLRRPPSDNLIELGRPNTPESSVRRSVLEDFDPLATMSTVDPVLPPSPPCVPPEDDQFGALVARAAPQEDQLSTSYYESSDPFHYMYGTSRGGSSMYGSSTGEPDLEPHGASPPPLPPRQRVAGPMTPEKPVNSAAFNTRRIQQYKKRQMSSEDVIATGGGIRIRKTSSLSCDSDILAFRDMVVSLRSCYRAADLITNPGLVTSATIETNRSLDATVKLVVYHKSRSSPVSFTCDVVSAVEHVVMQSICSMEASLHSSDPDAYMLRVYGAAEYLTRDSCLFDYQYVRRCIKYDEDVRLTLLLTDEVARPLARTEEDDERDLNMRAEDLIPQSAVDPVSYSQFGILLECVERECELVRRAALDTSLNSVRADRVSQAVKAVSALLGNVQTVELTEALDALASCCQRLTEAQVETRVELRIKLSRQLSQVLDALRLLLSMYTAAFRTDFSLVNDADAETVERPLTEVLDSVLIRVSALHRLAPDSEHQRYIVSAQIYHGSKAISMATATRPLHPRKHLFRWVVFDEWLEFIDVAISCLPREARLVLTVYGLSIVQPADSKEPSRVTQDELGWAAIQMFDASGLLSEGGFLLPLWNTEAMKELGPAPFPGTHPAANSCLAITVDLPTLGSRVRFPAVDDSSIVISRKDFCLLDENTQQLLMDTIETDIFSPVAPECRELLWDRRHYVMHEPAALPRVLLAAHSWEHAYLPELHAMTTHWSPLQPVDAIQLLLPSYPDGVVRGQAVRWLQCISSDELIDYLPQLVQAVKHEAWDNSALARFLLERSLTSPRVAHHLYWLLQQCLPGDGSDRGGPEARYLRRLTVLQRALCSVCGANLQGRFLAQEVLLRGLYAAAECVKSCRESSRLRELLRSLEGLQAALQDTTTALPLDPGLEVRGIDVATCAYFPSNTLPLRMHFRTADDPPALLPVIYKVGDDLRQDMLTIQMIRIMDRLWLRDGMDLRMVTFNCVPTGYCRGMIEMVQNAETLCAIQNEHGLTGAFKDMPISEWLAKHNPSALDYERAVQNFTASCAGYCVATYVLGICDRHNDNIMLRTSGHLFHIDFGKFLGDAQTFGAFKRDRAPFVLTSDMAYVINGGDKPSPRFQHFVDLCCNGFNIIRRNGNIFLHLFALMTSSGIPGVSRDAVDYIQRALLPNMVEQEAAAVFARLIQESLKSWFTPVNFFLHSLAQLRFNGDHNDGQLLSFIPKRYSESEDGRIESVTVHGYQKRYEPEKCYVYIIRVQREGMIDPVYLFRTYKEFLEFNQKLAIMFPLVDFYSLPKGGRLGRSHIKQVADSRRRGIEAFLRTLWQLADEVRRCELVYTFLHPLLRDQQEANIHIRKLKEVRAVVSRSQRYISGELQLSFSYAKNTFSVFVHHGKALATPDGQEPNAYVKLYLTPDPNKFTKRKTKVVRKNSHPSFMEMIVYRMPLAAVESRTLQASIWHQDHLQENLFLGAVVLNLADYELSRDTKQWHRLTNFHR